MRREELERSFAETAPAWWRGVQNRKGTKNRYVCTVDRTHSIISIDTDAGATPGAIPCGDKFDPKGCTGYMRSRFYNTNQNARPWWEWYRPEADEEGRFGKGPTQHEYVLNGGLLLRRLGVRRVTALSPLTEPFVRPAGR